MAKSKETQPVAEETPVSESTDLTTSFGSIEGTLERPKGLTGSVAGTEDIGLDDLRLPRLAIAQGLSNQLVPSDSSYIPDLKLFQMFNDLSRDIYGTGPLTFVPVQRSVKYIEFVPRDLGGGIVDMDVKPGDPRTKWTKDAEGKRVPPVATRFVEFIILLLRPGKVPEPIVLSIKDTNKFNRRASEQLTAFIKFRNAEIYAGLYKVEVKPEKNDKGTFGVYVVKNAGFIPVDTPAGKALFDHAKQFADSLEGKNIVVDREPVGDDDFDPAELERQSEM